MKSDIDDPHVLQYIDDLSARLRDLPKSERVEIVQGVEDHIRTEIRGGASIAHVLRGLGTPAEVAASANAGGGGNRHGDSTLYLISTTCLLLIGGFVIGAGWFVGVFLLWASKSRRLIEKVVCTLVWPGGLAAALISLYVPVDSRTRSFPSGEYTEHAGGDPWTVVYIVALFVIPVIVQGIFLTRALKRHE